MIRRNFFIVLTPNGRKLVAAAIIIIVAVLAVNTVIFAALIKGHRNPLEGVNIIIDPGHGGVDGGTNDGISFFEKDINLQIAKALQEKLHANKAAAELTRYTDVSLDSKNPSSGSRHLEDLTARVSQFNSGKYDIFISIHVNHSTSSRAIGPFVLYADGSPKSKLLGECVQERLNKHSEELLGSNTIRSPSRSNYFILRHSNIPGIIVETGFISNMREKSLLKDESYQQKLVDSIVKGIRDYYEKS